MLTAARNVRLAPPTAHAMRGHLATLRDREASYPHYRGSRLVPGVRRSGSYGERS